jgi:hypothetical protein
MGRFYEVRLQMALYGTIYVSRFVKIATGVRAILKFCINSFGDCNIGITDGKDL